MKRKIRKLSSLNILCMLLISQISFASLQGSAKYLGPVITFFNDFRTEFIIVLSVIAALLIIWFIWENMTDKNLPQLFKNIGAVAVIYVLTLKVPDIIIALGGAVIDMEVLQLIK